MYSEKLENLINAALADGVLTEKEKQVLLKNAEAEGIDLDEFEMILESRLYEKQKEQLETDLDSVEPKKGKFTDFMSSNPWVWKLSICVGIGIVGFLMFKLMLSWIIKVIICLLVLALIVGAVYVTSKMFNSNNG
ncbi:MAG: hypothetical protein LBS69_11180 [Prevotellaceae bacterium]|jgi:hypothetical protein|nr:hypothetical protein [Prevotellaceae bacterium]